MCKKKEKYKRPLMSCETDPNIITEFVSRGYHEIQGGKGIDGVVFFEEFEKRYSKEEKIE